MPSQDSKIEFDQYCKYVKTRSVVYTDIESLIVKINGRNKNSEKSTTAKVFSKKSLSIFNVYHMNI